MGARRPTHYDLLLEINGRTAAIEATVGELKERDKDKESRLDALEHREAVRTGREGAIRAALASVAGVIGAVVTWVLTKWNGGQP